MHRTRPRQRPWSAVALCTFAIACWAAGGYLLWLLATIGPAHQAINVRWAPATTDAERQWAVGQLKLKDGEEPEPGKWVYRLEDSSTAMIRQIVTHPLVEDTAHIDRQAFRVRLDAPGVPTLVTRLLEANLGPATALGCFLIGFVASWYGRRGLAPYLDRLVSSPHAGAAIAAAALLAGFAAFRDNGPSVDENIHYDQIARIVHGNWTLHPSLTMLPGFHAVAAAVLWLAGRVDEPTVRLVMLLLALATVAAFHALALTLRPERAGLLTLQFTLVPILFPQLFLIYTDVTSVLFVLLMMLATARRRLHVAGVLGIAACVIRQDNIVWVAFAMVWSHARDNGWTLGSISELIRRYWTFALAGGAFVAFVAANGGQVALGDDVGSHPLGVVRLTNVFFLLFLACFLFAPIWWGSRRVVLANLRGRPAWLALSLLFALFWFGFVNDHPHNNERADYFLPNAILMFFASQPFRKLLFFVPVAVTSACLAALPLRRPWWLLYPFTVLYLAPEWLVVPRYYLIPLTLFLLAREGAPPATERLQTGVFALASALLFIVVERGFGWV